MEQSREQGRANLMRNGERLLDRGNNSDDRAENSPSQNRSFLFEKDRFIKLAEGAYLTERTTVTTARKTIHPKTVPLDWFLSLQRVLT